ncbi:MAG: hypothetical protein AAB558_02885 [Patescibacteria group bacterium]
MKLTEQGGRRRGLSRSKDVIRPEVEPALPVIPAREKLLKEWADWKSAVLEWPAWRYTEDTPDDPGPFEHYMQFLLIVAAVAPEKIPEIQAAIGTEPWKQLKGYFEHKAEGQITRVDMWLAHAVGARVLFPEQAAEITRLFRPQMQKMFKPKHFLSEDSVGSYLIQTYLTDPEFPNLHELIEQHLPVLRKSLLAQLQTNDHATGVVSKAAFLFLLSPQDREMLQDRVMQYLKENKARVDLDFKSGQMDNHFAGYFIKEPWYSAVVVPTAKLSAGRITFAPEKSLTVATP